MNIEHLRYLLTIADCHSISRASEQLQLKQQYLSNLVRKMEDYFGTRIFDRHSRGITLTEDGRYLTEQARKIVELADSMENEYYYPSNVQRRGETGEITICTPPLQSHKYILGVFKEFLQQMPNIKLILLQNDRENNIAYVRSHENAIAFLMTMQQPDDLQASLPTSLQAVFLRQAQILAVTSTSNITAQNRKEISCQELVNLPLAAYAPFGLENNIAYHFLCQYGEPNISYVVDNNAFLQEILSIGNYYSLMERQQATGAGYLQIPLREEILVSVCIIAQEKALKESFAIRTLLKTLQKRCQA